ncbi:protein transport protein Sec24A [Trypanosoma rangeli SC58]|uniref:Protein transport protein Sec24A n=1 Tax=Trypanosoma rangeli SC58 TaxID=429131 RepID=A0A061J306_TRYRA|nr:protein transport protein Sec24A [Trypanosoma rangeli SC58]
MNFALPPEYLHSLQQAEAARAKNAREKMPNLYHAFEDPRHLQPWGTTAPQQAPQSMDEQQQAHYNYSQQQQQQQTSYAQHPQQSMPAQQLQQSQDFPQGAQTGRRSPPRSPCPQPYSQMNAQMQPSDSVLCWDVQLARSHDKSKFLDHPSIPRFLHLHLAEDMSRVPPTPSYIVPVSRISMRPTFQCLPATSQLADTLQLPLGITFQPFADTHLPEVDLSSVGGRMIRCRRCSAYINPFTTFCEQGRRWQCILCRQLNEVSQEYFCALDPQTGLRTDVLQRPELTYCSVDFHPTSEFLRRPPQRPAFLLMLDCSYQAIASGQLRAICHGVLSALETMKNEDATYMGVIGFASTVYFFNLGPTLRSPCTIVAPDIVHDVCNVDDNFKFEPIELPCAVNELVVHVKDAYHLLKCLFETLPETFASTKDVGCAFGPALAAAISMLENSGGKIVASIDAMPSIGEGKLKPRFDIAKLSNQPKEYTVCLAAADWYKQRALACSNSNISVDLLVSGAQDVDLATIAPLSRFTSGSIHRSTPLTINGMPEQVRRILTRYMAFESILRVRTSNGLVVPNFYGHCHVREPDLLALPVGDEDSSYSVQLQVGPELKANFAYIQIAIVHTNRARERRIRVHTYQLGVSSSLSAVVNSADSLGVACFLSKMAVDFAVNGPFQQAQKRVTDKLVAMLRAVKKHNDGLGLRCGHFMLPESLRFVPLLLHGFFRYAAVGLATSTPILPDQRVAAMSMVMSTAPHAMQPYYTGWSYEVYSPHAAPENLPMPIFPTQTYFRSDGIFLVHLGSTLVLWYGLKADAHILRAFGLTPSEGAPCSPQPLITEEQLAALRGRFDALVWHLLEGVRSAFSASLEACPQGNSVFEPALTRMMMEDEVQTLPSYTTFLRDLWQKVSVPGR